MSGVLAATIGGLVALVFFGASDWLASRNSKTHGGIEVNLAIQMTGALILGLVFLFSELIFPSLRQWSFIVGSAISFTAGYALFIKALSIGQAGVVVPLLNTYPLFTLIATYIFLSIQFSNFHISAMLIIVIGAILVGIEKMNWRKLHKNLNQEVLIALIAAVFLGLDIFFLNFVVDELPWETVGASTALLTALFILAFSFIRDRQRTLSALKQLPRNKVGSAAGVTLSLGAVGFFVGSELSGSAVIPGVIASGSVLITALLARVFDAEKLIFAKRIGAFLVVAGIIMLNLN